MTTQFIFDAKGRQNSIERHTRSLSFYFRWRNYDNAYARLSIKNLFKNQEVPRPPANPVIEAVDPRPPAPLADVPRPPSPPAVVHNHVLRSNSRRIQEIKATGIRIYNNKECTCQVFKTEWIYRGENVEAAAKILKVSSHRASEYRQEAFKTSNFGDVPRIVTLYDVLDEDLDENSSEVIIVTEYCPGKSLQKEIENRQ